MTSIESREVRRQVIRTMSAKEIADTLIAIIELELLEPGDRQIEGVVNPDFELRIRAQLYIEALESFGGFQATAKEPGKRLDPDLCVDVATRLADHASADVRAYAPDLLRGGL